MRDRATRAEIPPDLPINQIHDWPSFIDQIRARPGLWMGCASLTALENIINGIELAEYFYNVPEEKCFGGFSFAEFESWVDRLFNPQRLSVNSFWLARQAAESEKGAFSKWLDWYDRFRAEN